MNILLGLTTLLMVACGPTITATTTGASAVTSLPTATPTSTPSPVATTVSVPTATPTLNAVVVDAPYAYVTTEAGRFHILDISQPANPVELSVSEIAPPETRFSLSLVANYIYVFTDDRLLILDVTNPTRPVEAGALAPVCGDDVPRRVVPIGHRAYVVNGFFEAELCIIDLSDPTKPVEFGFYPLPGNAIRDVLAVGNLLYVANEDGGLWILQVKNN